MSNLISDGSGCPIQFTNYVYEPLTRILFYKNTLRLKSTFWYCDYELSFYRLSRHLQPCWCLPSPLLLSPNPVFIRWLESYLTGFPLRKFQILVEDFTVLVVSRYHWVVRKGSNTELIPLKGNQIMRVLKTTVKWDLSTNESVKKKRPRMKTSVWWMWMELQDKEAMRDSTRERTNQLWVHMVCDVCLGGKIKVKSKI